VIALLDLLGIVQENIRFLLAIRLFGLFCNLNSQSVNDYHHNFVYGLWIGKPSKGLWIIQLRIVVPFMVMQCHVIHKKRV